MSFLVVQAPRVPMSGATRQAWKDAGGVVLRPRGLSELRAFLQQVPTRFPDVEFILNSGMTQLTQDVCSVPLINNGPDVAWTLTPASTYEVLGDAMGEVNQDEYEGPFWHKGPGRKGHNKTYVPFGSLASQVELPEGYITQRHYEGTEYRVNTVGHRIVQVHQRSGPNSARTYRWTGLTNTATVLKSWLRGVLATHASDSRDGRVHLCSYGWDLILTRSDNSVCLEANSASGVNSPTATRIVTEIRRQLAESAN